MAKIIICSPFDRWKDGMYRAGPWVNIVLDNYSIDDKGRIYLSPDLMTDGEIDYACNRIIEQAEAARKAAKKKRRMLEAKMFPR